MAAGVLGVQDGVHEARQEAAPHKYVTKVVGRRRGAQQKDVVDARERQLDDALVRRKVVLEQLDEYRNAAAREEHVQRDRTLAAALDELGGLQPNRCLVLLARELGHDRNGANQTQMLPQLGVLARHLVDQLQCHVDHVRILLARRHRVHEVQHRNDGNVGHEMALELRVLVQDLAQLLARLNDLGRRRVASLQHRDQIVRLAQQRPLIRLANHKLARVGVVAQPPIACNHG